MAGIGESMGEAIDVRGRPPDTAGGVSQENMSMRTGAP